MSNTETTATVEISEAFDPDLFERGWRLYGARLNQALGAYRDHRNDCEVCPELEDDASNFSDTTLCSAGLLLLNASKEAHLAFRANAIEQARGAFVGLSDGRLGLVFNEPPLQAVLDPATQAEVNWLDEDDERHAFNVMLQHAAWGYDRLDALGWSGEPTWKQISRNLGFAGIAEKGRLRVAAIAQGEESAEAGPTWSIKEAQLLYELALHLHTELGEMRNELERNAEAAQAASAFAKAIRAGQVDEGALIGMAQQRDSELLTILDDYEPGTAARVLGLTSYYQKRVWWVLNGVEYTRPATAPYEALASGAY